MTDETGLIARAKKLGIDVKDTKSLIDSLEGARHQLSVASDSLELHATVLRERVRWLISEVDKLEAEIRGPT